MAGSTVIVQPRKLLNERQRNAGLELARFRTVSRRNSVCESGVSGVHIYTGDPQAEPQKVVVFRGSAGVLFLRIVVAFNVLPFGCVFLGAKGEWRYDSITSRLCGLLCTVRTVLPERTSTRTKRTCSVELSLPARRTAYP